MKQTSGFSRYASKQSFAPRLTVCEGSTAFLQPLIRGGVS